MRKSGNGLARKVDRFAMIGRREHDRKAVVFQSRKNVILVPHIVQEPSERLDHAVAGLLAKPQTYRAEAINLEQGDRSASTERHRLTNTA